MKKIDKAVQVIGQFFLLQNTKSVPERFWD